MSKYDNTDHDLADQSSRELELGAASPEALAWTLLADADTGGDSAIEEVLHEALAALILSPLEPTTRAAAKRTQSWEVALPRVREALTEARTSVHDRSSGVRASRALHVLDRLERSPVVTWTDGVPGVERSPGWLVWPDDESALVGPLPPLLDDAWWFLCAADAVGDAAVETHLREAVAVMLDTGATYQLGGEPPQTVPWPEAVRCAGAALSAYADSSTDPVEVLRAGRTAAALLSLRPGVPA